MRILVGLLLLGPLVACGADPRDDGAAAPAFDAHDGCSTATGPVAESADFVAWDERTSHPPPVTVSFGAVRDSVVRAWPFQPELDGTPARGMRRANGYLTVVYAPAPLPVGDTSPVPEHGLSLSTRRVPPGSGAWADSLESVFGERVTRVQLGPVEGTLNWADPQGTGTTVLDYPDGTLSDYLESLDRLERLGPAMVLPAHGPVLPALDAVARAYRDHRLGRLRAGPGGTGGAGGRCRPYRPLAVTDAVYADVDPSVRRAAELSVAAQLDYLRSGRR